MTDARWKGRPIDDLTREELIDAMHELVAFYEARLADQNHAIDVLG